MKILDRIENVLENVIEGIFRRNTSTQIQPVEIGRSLIKVMESQKRISISKNYVPNSYEIYLNPDQAHLFKSMHNTLAQELKEVLHDKAGKEELSFIGELQIVFLENPQLASNDIQVKAYFLEDVETTSIKNESTSHTQIFTTIDQIVRQPFLVFRNSEGERMISLVETPFSIGRSKQCDFTINDTNVSRIHALLCLENDNWKIKDNTSTNGTFVNEVKISESILQHNDLIRIGTTELTYKEYE